MNLDEFLSQAGDHGPCVGIYPKTASPLAPPAGFELRTIDGAHTKTRDALYDAFAEAWHFPPWFGRNMDAFDDFMRDLDNMINTESGKPPAPGYLTHIANADLILAEQPDAFPVQNLIGPPQYAPDQYGGNYTYVGKDATVILSKDGRVVTAWANSRNGWRNP